MVRSTKFPKLVVVVNLSNNHGNKMLLVNFGCLASLWGNKKIIIIKTKNMEEGELVYTFWRPLI